MKEFNRQWAPQLTWGEGKIRSVFNWSDETLFAQKTTTQQPTKRQSLIYYCLQGSVTSDIETSRPFLK
jgi:outer membrane cobalamin receptor